MTNNQILIGNLMVAYHLGRGLAMGMHVALRQRVIEETEAELDADFSKFKAALTVATFNETQKNFSDIETLIEEFYGFLKMNPAAYEEDGDTLYIPGENVHKDSKTRRAILRYLASHGLVETFVECGKTRYSKTIRKYGRRMVVLKRSVLEIKGG